MSCRVDSKRFASFLFLVCNGTASHAETFSGRVVGVADGDTITVLDAGHVQHKIRIMGIDAPEKAQPFGNQSKQHLQTWCSQIVTADLRKRDRYGQIVGKIWV